MKLILAPMEGVVDPLLRSLYADIGGVDLFVTEFIRVTHYLLPDHMFYRLAPELKTNGLVNQKIPLHLQLLGGDSTLMAENAVKAVELGARGIDLNFGCPAKTVNKNDGGAKLLQTPERIHEIVAQVRKVVPQDIPVTVKIRLGYDSTEKTFDIVRGIDSIGVNWLTVHARTKTDGYHKPAQWDWIFKIKNEIQTPLVANGDIGSVHDFFECKRQTKASHFMIGRGAICRPDLFFLIRSVLRGQSSQPFEFSAVEKRLFDFFQQGLNQEGPLYAMARIKQWTRFLAQAYPEAEALFKDIRVIKDIEAMRNRLSPQGHLVFGTPLISAPL